MVLLSMNPDGCIVGGKVSSLRANAPHVREVADMVWLFDCLLDGQAETFLPLRQTTTSFERSDEGTLSGIVRLMRMRS